MNMEEIGERVVHDTTTGIYYGYAMLNGTVYPSVISVGWNPYFDNKAKTVVRTEKNTPKKKKKQAAAAALYLPWPKHKSHVMRADGSVRFGSVDSVNSVPWYIVDDGWPRE